MGVGVVEGDAEEELCDEEPIREDVGFGVEEFGG